jgi:hypothetical protein
MASTISTEMEKLNKAQRNAMRRIAPSTLSALSVEQVGWTTVVRCESHGFTYRVKLGPRGRVLDKHVWEQASRRAA